MEVRGWSCVVGPPTCVWVLGMEPKLAGRRRAFSCQATPGTPTLLWPSFYFAQLLCGLGRSFVLLLPSLETKPSISVAFRLLACFYCCFTALGIEPRFSLTQGRQVTFQTRHTELWSLLA